MPIKRPAAAAVPTIKRVEKKTATAEFATKESLEDRLIVVTNTSYDPAYLGQYGPTPKIVVDVIDVEDGSTYSSVWFFGNLARQLGEGLGVGEIGAGRIVSGPTKSGNGTWYGFAYSTDAADYEAAEKALPKF